MVGRARKRTVPWSFVNGRNRSQFYTPVAYYVRLSRTCRYTRVFSARGGLPRPVRPFRRRQRNHQENTALFQRYPDRVADRVEGPRGVEDVVRVWSMASATPAATLVRRWLTVWPPCGIYATQCCMMLFIFLIFSFVIFILFFLFLYLAAFIPLLPFFSQVSLTCAAVETSTASCRCQRCARSNPATACARTVVNPVARWTAACFSRAGGRTRGRLFARGRPCQPSWPSFRWIEIAATGWTALQTTVAVAPRDGAWRFRHPLFLHSGHGRRDQRADPINTCPPRIRGRTVRVVPRHRAPRHEPPRTRRNVDLRHLSVPPIDSLLDLVRNTRAIDRFISEGNCHGSDELHGKLFRW